MTGMMRPKPKKMKRSRRKRRYRSRAYLTSSAPRGSRENSTFEPSSGGIGTRLNTPRRMLMKMIWETKKPKDESGVAKAPLVNEGASVAPAMAVRSAPLKGKSRRPAENAAARARVENGPAQATRRSPIRGFLRFRGSYGTG